MKIKLACILAGLFLCVLPISAQLKLGVEAGVNLSHYLSKDGVYAANQVGGIKAGFQLGIATDYSLDKHWMLISGLQFLQNRSTMKLADHSVFYFPKTDIKINNLMLPLKVGYDIRFSDKFSLLPSVGAYVSYGFSAGNCSLDVIRQEGDNITTEPATWKPMNGYFYQTGEHNYGELQSFDHWDYGVVVGIKAVVARHYTIGFDYTVGIKKVQEQNSLRNSTFQFSVGYRF